MSEIDEKGIGWRIVEGDGRHRGDFRGGPGGFRRKETRNPDTPFAEIRWKHMEKGNPPKIRPKRKIETKTQIIVYLLNDLDTLSLF